MARPGLNDEANDAPLAACFVRDLTLTSRALLRQIWGNGREVGEIESTGAATTNAARPTGHESAPS